jgi:hypothetical protein
MRPVKAHARGLVKVASCLTVLTAMLAWGAGCRSNRGGATGRGAAVEGQDALAGSASPASLRTPGVEPRFESPEPAELVTLDLALEDKGEVSLIYSLPRELRFECRELRHRIVTGPDRVDVVLAGIVPLDPKSEKGAACRLVKEPPPFRERLLLPLRAWHHLAFHWGAHVDSYALAVEPDRIEFTPVGKPAFTRPSETGRLLRVGADWLWVSFRFLGEDSLRRLGDKRDALLRDLQALGARPFEPAAGTYLLVRGTHKVPADTAAIADGPEHGEVARFFRFSGDWKAVEDLRARYLKFNPPVRYRSSNMTVWLSQRHRGVSTY